jgi:hypothetical protein
VHGRLLGPTGVGQRLGGARRLVQRGGQGVADGRDVVHFVTRVGEPPGHALAGSLDLLARDRELEHGRIHLGRGPDPAGDPDHDEQVGHDLPKADPGPVRV